LIGLIKGEIEKKKVKSLKSPLKTELRGSKTNDDFVRHAEIQESNCKNPRVRLKRLPKIRTSLS
jgi:hypothetical protein